MAWNPCLCFCIRLKTGVKLIATIHGLGSIFMVGWGLALILVQLAAECRVPNKVPPLIPFDFDVPAILDCRLVYLGLIYIIRGCMGLALAIVLYIAAYQKSVPKCKLWLMWQYTEILCTCIGIIRQTAYRDWKALWFEVPEKTVIFGFTGYSILVVLAFIHKYKNFKIEQSEDSQNVELTWLK